MARHKNADWNIPDSVISWEQAQTAVLMDIRDELKRLNSLLHCSNFVGIPTTLRSIRRALAKPRKPKRKG